MLNVIASESYLSQKIVDLQKHSIGRDKMIPNRALEYQFNWFPQWMDLVLNIEISKDEQ
jgi:hypothetical protein